MCLHATSICTSSILLCRLLRKTLWRENEARQSFLLNSEATLALVNTSAGCIPVLNNQWYRFLMRNTFGFLCFLFPCFRRHYSALSPQCHAGYSLCDICPPGVSDVPLCAQSTESRFQCSTSSPHTHTHVIDSFELMKWDSEKCWKAWIMNPDGYCLKCLKYCQSQTAK